MAGQLWGTSSLGAYFTNQELSRELRVVSQPTFRFRQFVEAKNAKGKNRGDKLYFDKIKNVATQGGTLVETTTIPETNYTIVQGTLTINEYGNAIPFTGKLDVLSEFDVNNTVVIALRNDYEKVLDSAVGSQFTSNAYKYVCTSGTSSALTTNGTFTASATADINAFHVKQIVKSFKTRNIRPYADGQDYICIAGPQAMFGMFNDTGAGGWIDVSKYTDSYASGIFNGEVGKYHQVRFVEETNFLSNTVGNSSAYGEAIFFGIDAVMEGVAVPEEIRAKIPQDYGRDMGLCWYALLGYQLTWSQSVDGEDHVIHVKSA